MSEVVVIGGGTMGAGIAASFLVAGVSVRVHESSGERGELARERVEDSLVRLARRRDDLDPSARLALLEVAIDYGVDDSPALVVEAVPEDAELKTRVLALAEAAYPGAMLATNTSSLSISGIAAGLVDPTMLVGMHFFNPVPISTLVEVVFGERTSDATVDAALRWVEKLAKTPILVRDVPGFASSRLGVTLALEAVRMLEEGVASAADIDRAMELGYRHPMGPLRVTDLVVLDVRVAIADHLRDELGERFAVPELMRRMVAEGRLGQKTGQGFYSWSN
jgi:3-hydroxybutyryl-CoA dehydrogenase